MINFQDLSLDRLRELAIENGLMLSSDTSQWEAQIGMDVDGYRQFAAYLAAIVFCGDRVAIGDVEYGLMASPTTGSLIWFRTEPGNPKSGTKITRSAMLSEWAFCWHDAAPPMLLERAR